MGRRVFPRGYIPRRGDKFGKLTVAGKSEVRKLTNGGSKCFSEVRCGHGNLRYVPVCDLKLGKSTSCQGWMECLPKQGDRFGKLIATGVNELRKRKSGKRRSFIQVFCKHGRTRFIELSSLTTGNTLSCRRWEECSLPKRGSCFGKLTVTGRYKYRKGVSLTEVACHHGNTKFVLTGNLKNGASTSCGNRGECGLTKYQFHHLLYIRRRIPRSKLSELSEQQDGVCIVCGNTRRHGVLNTIEHLIPVIAFVRSKWSLKEKNARANSLTNLFASHRTCNTSRGKSSLRSYWKKHPECEAPARAAIERARQARQQVQLLKAA